MLKLCVVEIAAHLHKLRHGDIASATASKVRATFCAALDDALHLGCHFGALRQRAVLKTVHVLPTLPVAHDDFKAFLAFLLHVLHGQLVVFMRHLCLPFDGPIRGEDLMTMTPIVETAKAHQTAEAKEAGEKPQKRTAQMHGSRALKGKAKLPEN